MEPQPPWCCWPRAGGSCAPASHTAHCGCRHRTLPRWPRHEPGLCGCGPGPRPPRPGPSPRRGHSPERPSCHCPHTPSCARPLSLGRPAGERGAPFREAAPAPGAAVFGGLCGESCVCPAASAVVWAAQECLDLCCLWSERAGSPGSSRSFGRSRPDDGRNRNENFLSVRLYSCAIGPQLLTHPSHGHQPEAFRFPFYK